LPHPVPVREAEVLTVAGKKGDHRLKIYWFFTRVHRKKEEGGIFKISLSFGGKWALRRARKKNTDGAGPILNKGGVSWGGLGREG